MAGSSQALRPAGKGPEKPAEKPVGKAAPVAPGKGAPGKPAAAAAKPPGKDAPGSAALPDAALLDENGEPIAVEAAAAGWRAWLEPGRKRWIAIATGSACLVGLITAGVVTASYVKGPPLPESQVIAGPAQAIDGGTLIVAGQTLRLEDIAAPPAAFVCLDGGWKYRCGDEARKGLAAALGSGTVECVHAHPVPGGQLAALCRNDSGLDIAAIQVESGWAVNDIRRSSRYFAEEARARNSGRGLWRNDFAQPELWTDRPQTRKSSREESAGPRR